MTHAGLFDTVAREYANFRPGYPTALFAWLAGQCESRELVWDCGCGSGQASLSLARHFARVHATDISAEQIAAATPHPGITYRVAPAEDSRLPAGSADLITVAQALHWFDLEKFYAEVLRVTRIGGLLAVWTYPRPEFLDPALDRVFLDFYSRVVGPYWPPERRHVEAGYSTLTFPPPERFEELRSPPFALELSWSLAQVLGYVSSWSATARYRQALAADPVPLLAEALAPCWPAAGGSVPVRMPLGLRVARLVR